MRCWFWGTPAFAVPALEALVRAGHEVLGVVCQPDRPRGRGREWQMPEVKQVALKLGLPVWQPESLKDPAFVQTLHAHVPDVAVLVSYGKIIPQMILDLPRLGFINIHPSLLPRYRGASPLQAALAHGDTETGVSIMKMTAQMDAGPIYLQKKYKIQEGETYGTLHDRLAQAGAGDVLEILRGLDSKSLQPVLQNDAQATYCAKIDALSCRLDWCRPAQELVWQVRSLSPQPGAMFFYEGQVFKIFDAVAVEDEGTEIPGTVVTVQAKKGLAMRTGKGLLWLLCLQRQGGKCLAVKDFLNGTHPFVQGGCCA